MAFIIYICMPKLNGFLYIRMSYLPHIAAITAKLDRGMNLHAASCGVSRHTRGNGYPESKQPGFPIGVGNDGQGVDH